MSGADPSISKREGSNPGKRGGGNSQPYICPHSNNNGKLQTNSNIKLILNNQNKVFTKSSSFMKSPYIILNKYNSIQNGSKKKLFLLKFLFL